LKGRSDHTAASYGTSVLEEGAGSAPMEVHGLSSAGSVETAARTRSAPHLGESHVQNEATAARARAVPAMAGDTIGGAGREEATRSTAAAAVPARAAGETISPSPAATSSESERPRIFRMRTRTTHLPFPGSKSTYSGSSRATPVPPGQAATGRGGRRESSVGSGTSRGRTRPPGVECPVRLPEARSVPMAGIASQLGRRHFSSTLARKPP